MAAPAVATTEPAAVAPTWWWLLTALLLLAAITLGGSSRGSVGDAWVQALALGVLTAQVALPRLGNRQRRLLWVPLLLVLMLPLLHSLPIAVSGGATGALRAQLAIDLHLAGTVLVPQLSVHPLAAERALWSLLPALAMWVAVWRLGFRQRLWLLAVLLLMAIGSVLLGMAQLADGQQSTWRPYLPTNPNDAVGLFANRNHLAALLVASLPVMIGAAAWFLQRHRRGSIHQWLRGWALAGFSILLLLGIALARSRAGIVLGMLALLLCVPILWQLRDRQRAGRLLFWMGLVALVCTVQFGLFGILQRLEKDPLDDGRWEYARVVSVAAAATAPLGSGIGTFTSVYPRYEAETGAGPHDTIINHAHNDVLELWLEAGWPFVVVFSAFVLWLAWLGARLWRGRLLSLPQEPLFVARLAFVSVLLLVAHSALDYPLRTTAMMTVFSMLLAQCSALVLPPTPMPRLSFASFRNLDR